MNSPKFAIALVALLMVVPLAGATSPVLSGSAARVVAALEPRPAPAVSGGSSAFGVVDNFENGKLGAFSATSGKASVVKSPDYGGEPALKSAGTSAAPQIDVAHRGFVSGARRISFQAVLLANGAEGYVGLEGPTGPVAVLGLSKGAIMAGTSPTTASSVGLVPTSTAQPAGWVELVAEVFSTGSGTSTHWLMDVYADRTVHPVASNLSVPSADNYTGGVLETLNNTEYYSDVIFTTNTIAEVVPGYNPMEGYGQGSGDYVGNLPNFTVLKAVETLDNWSTPEAGILSFQINAMNLSGTDHSTCRGFFQLGVNLNPNGRITPWYVPGIGCIAHDFGHPGGWKGFHSPNGTVLDLTITDSPSNGTITFQIVDRSVKGADRNWLAVIPYSQTEFYGEYTQLEFQPSSRFPITDYFFNGSLSGMAMSGGSLSTPIAPAASYMLPFLLNEPYTWNLNYYSSALAGYDETG